MLHAMTTGERLEDAYTAALARMKAQTGVKSRLAMQALMWVFYSERPLHVFELCHALGVEKGSPDSTTENIPDIGTVLRCSLGLLTVDVSSSTVRLVHYTLQEYLSDNPTLFHSPHSTIAEVCLTYLNFQRVRDLSPTLSSAPPTTPFLNYASCYWGAHARRETTESMMPLALRLLDRFDKHLSSNLLILHTGYWRKHGAYNKYCPEGFTGLHYAAFFGLVDITVALLKVKKWDLNVTNSEGDTALMLAAMNGHEGVMKILLKKIGINPDMADSWGRRPLSLAAENGHVGAVKMLLELTGVNPETADYIHQTPFLLAANNGHEEVVRILLERIGNPHKPDGYDQTPLLGATENGHVGVVKILLEQTGVNPEMADCFGRTPLLAATKNGYEEVVKMLLERNNVNPETADKNGRTPLSWAIQNGHKGIANLLRERVRSLPNLQARRSTDLTQNESSELPESPSKRIRHS